MTSADIIFARKAAKLEARNERISAIITTVLVLLLMLALMLNFLYRQSMETEIGTKEYEVMGSIDFGDFTQGSRNINNFDPPVENPTPSPQPNPQAVETPPQPSPSPSAAPSEAATPSDANPTPSEIITSPDPAPVTQPPQTETPQETTPTTPQTVENNTPQENTTNDTGSSTQPAEDDDEEPLVFENTPGGSNQGNNDSGTGNSGSPDIKTLDPDGLYDFGTGDGQGAPGRSAIALPKPRYSVQEEGRITYRFIIDTDGSVLNVTAAGPVAANQQQIKKAGMVAIYNWKFSKGRRQTVTVTITFKLKN